MNDVTGVRWSSGGPFGVVPAWVLEAGVSDKAIRLYAVLARLAGSPEAATFRGHGELEERLGCGRTAVKNALAELVAIDAVTVEERHRLDGGRDTNVYVVHATPLPSTRTTPVAPAPSPPGAVTPGSTHEEEQRREPTKGEIGTDPPSARQTIVARRGMAVARVPASDAELDLAIDVLHAFNEIFGTGYNSQDWLRKIVLRIREHPDLTLDAHRDVMQRAAQRPWWTGAAGPAVVYGNGALFEKALEDTKVGEVVNEDALTPEQIRRMGDA